MSGVLRVTTRRRRVVPPMEERGRPRGAAGAAAVRPDGADRIRQSRADAARGDPGKPLTPASCFLGNPEQSLSSDRASCLRTAAEEEEKRRAPGPWSGPRLELVWRKRRMLTG